MPGRRTSVFAYGCAVQALHLGPGNATTGAARSETLYIYISVYIYIYIHVYVYIYIYIYLSYIYIHIYRLLVL